MKQDPPPPDRLDQEFLAAAVALLQPAMVTGKQWGSRLRHRLNDWAGQVSPLLVQPIAAPHPPADSPVAEVAEAMTTPVSDGGVSHMDLAKDSLRELLTDTRVPAEIRLALTQDYRQVEEMLDRLEKEQIHVAVCGRVSVGKSAMINALLGENRFSVSPLHGETKNVQLADWREATSGQVILIDTPGINEVDGAAREQLAMEVAHRSDLAIFVVDGDLTDSEFLILKSLAQRRLPILLILNKADRYTTEEQRLLLESLQQRTNGLLAPEWIAPCAARPAARIVIQVGLDGRETETNRIPPPDMDGVRDLLWRILDAEGKTLAALNASLFAGRLSDQVAGRIAQVKRELSERLVRAYCLGKGVAVGINPLPIADILTAVVDTAMVVQLGRLHGMTVQAGEAGNMLKVIIQQMMLLMGTILGVQVASSALKGVSAGFSTILTAGAQGAAAYYCTYIVGRAAERYFIQGRSWGPGGPKQVVREILATLDNDSILRQARTDILTRLRLVEPPTPI